MRHTGPPPTSYPQLLCGRWAEGTVVKAGAEVVKVPHHSNQSNFSRVRDPSKDPSISSQAVCSPLFLPVYDLPTHTGK